MATTPSTPNGYLSKITTGSSGWGDIANANMDVIDLELGKRLLQTIYAAHTTNTNGAAHNSSGIRSQSADTALGPDHTLEDLLSAIIGGDGSLVADLNDLSIHLESGSAHDATDITYNATTVKAALDQLFGYTTIGDYPETIGVVQLAGSYSLFVSIKQDTSYYGMYDVYLLYDNSTNTEINDTNTGICEHYTMHGSNCVIRLVEGRTASHVHLNVRKRGFGEIQALDGDATVHAIVTSPQASVADTATIKYIVDQIIAKIEVSGTDLIAKS